MSVRSRLVLGALTTCAALYLSSIAIHLGSRADREPVSSVEVRARAVSELLALEEVRVDAAPLRLPGGTCGGSADRVRLLLREPVHELPVANAIAREADGREALGHSDSGGRLDLLRSYLTAGLRLEAADYASCFLDEALLALCPLREGRHVVELSPLAPLEVRVESPNGEPLAGVELWVGSSRARLASHDARLVASVEHLELGGWSRSFARPRRIPHAAFAGLTDAAGRLELAQVPLEIELFVVARSDQLLERRELLLEAPGQSLLIRACAGRELTGRLVWDDGQPLDGAWLRLFDGSRSEDSTLAAGGRFHFYRVQSPEVRLEVLKPQAFSSVIDVEACAGDAPDIVLARCGTIAGRLQLEGEPEQAQADSWWLECWQGSALVGTTQVQRDAHFELSVPNGPSRLLFRCSTSWPAPVQLALDCVAPALDLTVDAGAPLPRARLQLLGIPAGTKVSLHEYRPDERQPGFQTRASWSQAEVVVGADGLIERRHLAPGACAWLVDAGPSGAAWTGLIEIAPTGTTRIGPLSTGFARVERRALAGAPELLLISPVFDPVRVPAELLAEACEPWFAPLAPGPWCALPRAAAGAPRVEDAFELYPFARHQLDGEAVELGTLSGLVRSGASPEPGFTLTLRREDGVAALEELSRCRSEADGSFQLKAVQPGRARLSARDAQDRLRAIESLEIVAGEETQLELQLGGAESALALRFLDDGQPLRGIERVWGASWPGTSARACAPLCESAWSAEGLAGRTLFALRTTRTRATGSPYQDACLLGEARLDSDCAEVELYRGRLHLSLPPEPGVAAPIAYVEEVDGLDPRLLANGWQPVLAREGLGGREIEYLHVPPRCRLRLWGLDAEGRPHVEQLVLEGESSRCLEWKP